MNAEQRRLFEETLVEDEAGLREQLERLRREAAGTAAASDTTTKASPRRPRRNPFPEYLRAAWNTTMSPSAPTAKSLAVDVP